MRRRTLLWVTPIAAAVLATVGCTDESAPRGVLPDAAVPPAAEAGESGSAPDEAPSAPTTSSAPEGAFDSVLDGLAEQEREVWLEAYGGLECAPWSLIVDYDAGLLTPEEYTAYSYYALSDALPRPADAPSLSARLPERYRPCDDDSIQVLGFSAGMYLDHIDPEFRDDLWVEVTGQTWDEAQRPIDGEALDEALERYVDEEPVEP